MHSEGAPVHQSDNSRHYNLFFFEMQPKLKNHSPDQIPIRSCGFTRGVFAPLPEIMAVIPKPMWNPH